MEFIDTGEMEYEDLPPSLRGMLTSRKLLREGEVLPGVGVYALLAKFHEGARAFSAPRHVHNFEQFRVVLSGEMEFGSDLKCRAGDVIYFPAGVPYGPERTAGGEQLLLQWGPDWVTQQQNRAAMTELAQTGEFVDGKYRFLAEDGQTKAIDASQAVWQKVHGRRQVFVRPRYGRPIRMIPSNFSWTADTPFSRKHLGTFSETDVEVSMVRWEQETSLSLSPERTWLVYGLDGRFSALRSSGREGSVIWSDYGAEDEMKASAGAVALVVGFPRSMSTPGEFQ